MVTCGSSDGGFRGVQTVAIDGLGATPPLLASAGGSRFDDGVHVLHQFQLLPPEVLLLDELTPGLVLLLPDSLLLCFQSASIDNEYWIRFFLFAALSTVSMRGLLLLL